MSTAGLLPASRTTPSRAVPRLVLVVDVSGSVDDALLQRFAREVGALSRRLAATRVLAIAAACLLVQVVETQSGWRGLMVGPERSGREWSNPLVAPQWEALAPHYQRIRALPVENGGPWWRDLASFAEFHGMSTDAANLGRADPAALAAAQAAGREALATGALDPGAIYVLGEAEAQSIRPHVGPEDFFGTLDGLTVFARGGRAYATPPAAR